MHSGEITTSKWKKILKHLKSEFRSVACLLGCQKRNQALSCLVGVKKYLAQGFTNDGHAVPIKPSDFTLISLVKHPKMHHLVALVI